MEKSSENIYYEIKEKFNHSSNSLDAKVDDAISSLSELIKSKNCKVIEPYAFLFLCYLQKNMVVEAGFLLAEYNLPCDFGPAFYDVPDELKSWFNGGSESYEEYMINAILFNEDIYDRLMRFAADKKYELAKILICVARYRKRKADITRLSHCINVPQNKKEEMLKRTKWRLNGWWYDDIIQNKDNFERVDMIIAADKLSDLIITGDDGQIKNAINEAYRLYKNRKTIMDDQEYGTLDYFWTTLITGLIYLKEYQTAIRIYYDQSHRVSDAEFFLMAAKALLEADKTEEGVIACRTSCSLSQNSENLLLLGKLLFHKRKYAEALNAYMDACNLLNEKKKAEIFYRSSDKYKKYTFEVEYTDSEAIDIKRQAYIQLLYCYIKQGDLSYAKQLVELSKNELNDIAAVDQMLSIVELSSAATIEIDQLKRDNNTIKEAFEAEREKNDQYKSFITKIENKLNQIRTNDSAEIDDAAWDELFSGKMSEIISSIRTQIGSNKENVYNEIYEEIEKRFPKMRKDTIRTLSSAEQMYRVFCNNIYIDQAPIIVEYSRAVEMLLWDYVEGSGDFLKEIEEACSYNSQGKTFGAVNSVINCRKCPLRNIYYTLNDLRKARNNSAHVIDKGSRMTISQIHDFIWKENGLLETVNSLW